jgi:hypothetical protein
MLKHSVAGLVFALSVGGLAQAAPIVTQTNLSDSGYQAYVTGLSGTEIAVAQARIGRPGNADYEIGLHTPPNFTNASPLPGGNTQYNWNSGSPVSFTLSRAGDDLTFTMGGYSATYNGADVSEINLLVFRAASATDSTASLSKLILNGTSLSGPSAGNGARNSNIVEGIDAGNFTLTGNVTLSWSGSPPVGSNLAVQIKAFDSVAVPEPGTRDGDIPIPRHFRPRATRSCAPRPASPGWPPSARSSQPASRRPSRCSPCS